MERSIHQIVTRAALMFRGVHSAAHNKDHDECHNRANGKGDQQLGNKSKGTVTLVIDVFFRVAGGVGTWPVIASDIAVNRTAVLKCLKIGG